MTQRVGFRKLELVQVRSNRVQVFVVSLNRFFDCL